MFNRFRQPLSRAQNAVLNPVPLTSEKAVVISLAKSGLYDNVKGIPTCSVTVEPTENPGHPIQITGLASLARRVHELAVGDVVTFEGTIQGSLARGRSPYVVLSSIDKAPEQNGL